MDKIYCGNGKEKTFSGGGSIISVTLDLDQLVSQYNEHGYLAKNGTRTIKIDVGTRRTIGNYGETHSVSINTWHPDFFNKPRPATLVYAEAGKEIGPEEELLF